MNLYIDNEFFCGLSLNQVALHRLHKGQQLTDEELARIRDDALLSKAYHAAIGYVALRIRSMQEVREYLTRKGYEDQATGVIDRLEQERYLNDEDFASRWMKMRQEQNWSPRAIQAELYKKGIKIALHDIEGSFSVQSAIGAHIQKKTRHRHVERDKLMAYLAGKGFSYPDIKSALDSFGL